MNSLPPEKPYLLVLFLFLRSSLSTRPCSTYQILLSITIMTPYTLPSADGSVSSILDPHPCMSRPLHVVNASPNYAFLGRGQRLMPTNACLPQDQTSRTWGVIRYIHVLLVDFHLIRHALKSQLPVVKGPRAYHRPPRDRIMTVSCRESNPASRTHTPALTNSAPPAVLASHRMSEPYLGGRSLSPSFLDLTDSSEYHSPSDTPAPTMTSTSRVKRKGKPPPLILRDSFHSTVSLSPTLPPPPNDAKAAPLPPMTPFTPISPRYQMPSEKEQLRRRLLKLQRTLGEQITPGLVVRPKPSSETTAGPPDNSKRRQTFIKPQRRGGASFNATFDHFPIRSTLCDPAAQDLLHLDSNFLNNPPLTHKRKNSAPVPPSPSVYSHRNYLPETVALSPMTLTAFAGSVTSRRVTSTTPSLDFVLSYDVQYSLSEDEEDGDSDTPPVSPFDDSYSPSPVQSDYNSHTDEVKATPVNMPYLALNRTRLPTTPNTPGIRRKERRHGWSGEWNQPHIQDVIEKLRIL